MASISSLLTRGCCYFQHVFRTCKKIIVNLNANRTLAKACLELKGFSSNRFDKIMASVPMWRYFCLFRHCLLNGGKWSSDLWSVEAAESSCGLFPVVCVFESFHSGSETEAKILCKSLSTVSPLIRVFYATCCNSIQEHMIVILFFY